MKIKHSLYSRRQFLNGLVGGGVGAAFISLLSPIIKFVTPPYKEPDEVRLPQTDYKDLAPNAAKVFPWGSKPGFLKRKEDGTYMALVGVCSHLDCNVNWQPETKKFYCACHEGWYDENGKNIAGPPPKPLRRLDVAVEGEEIVITKPGVA
jgi:cytochrome b6-f complex iron-sulfur subunit